jgi:hypothetical protein
MTVDLEYTYETIEGVQGLVGTRVMEYGGNLCLEVEPQDPRYAEGDPPRPPILRIALSDPSAEAIAKGKTYIPEALASLLES